MEITREEDEDKGRFVAKENGEEMGQMTYSRGDEGKLLIVDHTGVNEAFKGKGVGKALFEHLVTTVRSEGKIIMPLCPFVRSMFEKNPDKHDVLRFGSL